MNNLEIKRAESILESILFASGEPISLSKLCSIAEMEKKEATAILQDMMDKINADASRGIKLLKLGDSYQFATSEDNFNYVKRLLNNRKIAPLSQASLEVLAIIAYNQPVTRSYIDQIRGVESSAVVANLCEKELIEEKGRLDAPGRPLLFGTTPNFLRCFGISSLEQLPDLPDLQDKKEDDYQESF